jgi:hypothetical protein
MYIKNVYKDYFKECFVTALCTISWKLPDLQFAPMANFLADVVATGSAQCVADIFANFRGKNSKCHYGAHAGVTLSLEIVMLLSLTTVKVQFYLTAPAQ